MTENKSSTPLDSADDAPDLSTPEWQAAFAKVEVRRGRPKAAQRKVSTTIRIDQDIVEHFKRGGAGWQTRLNDFLRKALSKPKTRSAVKVVRRAAVRPPVKKRA